MKRHGLIIKLHNRRVADVDSQATRCHKCGRFVGPDGYRDDLEIEGVKGDGGSSLCPKHLAEFAAKLDHCADCESKDGYIQTLWTAGGDRIGDYREAKEEVYLCDDCASAYGICEQCGDLISDEVFVPPGRDFLCPACRDKENDR
jgi:ribosomal protein S14